MMSTLRYVVISDFSQTNDYQRSAHILSTTFHPSLPCSCDCFASFDFIGGTCLFIDPCADALCGDNGACVADFNGQARLVLCSPCYCYIGAYGDLKKKHFITAVYRPHEIQNRFHER